MEWMTATATLDGEEGLAGKVVDAYSALFRSSNRRVNLNKVRDWRRKRFALQAQSDDDHQRKYARSRAGNRQQFVIKVAGGRGPKLGEHWAWLYPILLAEFGRLRKAGVKMSSRLLLDIAVTLIKDSTHKMFN